MAYKLFALSEDGDIVINKVEILTIPVFKKILQRDKGSEGDSDGRKKFKAFKEFAYIYHIADANSVPNRQGHSSIKAHKYALDKSRLDFTYKPDDVVKLAIDEYKSQQSHIAVETIQELVKTFKLINPLVGSIRKTLENYIKINDLSVESINDIFSKIGMLVKMSKDIPSMVRDLNVSIATLQTEVDNSDVDLMRGSGEKIPNSADPNKDY